MTSREFLEARIERERDELALAIEEIRSGARARIRLARSQLDLRRHVRRRPGAWIAGAVVLGFLIGARR